MKHALKISIALVIYYLIFVFSSYASQRTALVIGNASYSTGSLGSTTNGAQDIANALKDCGFKVLLLLNASNKDMKTAVKSFGSHLQVHGGVGLFYFAGYGIQVNGSSYLIPVNSDITSESDIEFESLDVGRVLWEMKNSGTDINIVIIDAYHNSLFGRSLRTSLKGLAELDAPKGSIIAYATSPESISADGIKSTGVYTKHLLENMKRQGLSIERIFKNVRIAVARETLNEQIPWEMSSLMDDFYFRNDQLERQPHIMSDKGLKNQEIALEYKKIELEKERLELVRKGLEKDLDLIELGKEKLSTFKSLTTSGQIFNSTDPKILLIDGGFVKFKNGIVLDTKTDLEWLAGPDEDLDMKKTMNWVDSLRNKEDDWQIPSISELEVLHESGLTPERINSLFGLNKWRIWSNTGVTELGSHYGYVRFFDFKPGFYKEITVLAMKSTRGIRAFAVRKRQ